MLSTPSEVGLFGSGKYQIRLLLAYPWERPMKNLQRVRTRRQLLRVTAVGAASIPFLALAKKSASAPRHRGGSDHPRTQDHHQATAAAF